ncbi:MAG: phosphonate degradation HD-domain oxygenase [Planctomycetota bacterium]
MSKAYGLELQEGRLRMLAELFDRRGRHVYGESVTQLQHALQCAALAEQEEASDALVTAALLHDVGHLLHRDAQQAFDDGVDDRHEAIGASYLGAWFGDEVTRPIALHVQAKRYLCHVDPVYHRDLSPQSQATLRLQGGPMDPAEATAFGRRPHAASAIRVRRWDDAGKQPNRWTPPLSHFLKVAATCLVDRD